MPIHFAFGDEEPVPPSTTGGLLPVLLEFTKHPDLLRDFAEGSVNTVQHWAAKLRRDPHRRPPGRWIFITQTQARDPRGNTRTAKAYACYEPSQETLARWPRARVVDGGYAG